MKQHKVRRDPDTGHFEVFVAETDESWEFVVAYYSPDTGAMNPLTFEREEVAAEFAAMLDLKVVE